MCLVSHFTVTITVALFEMAYKNESLFRPNIWLRFMVETKGIFKHIHQKDRIFIAKSFKIGNI